MTSVETPAHPACSPPIRRAALVLSGGGALGAAHIGAVRALERHGIGFDFYAGVSAGAILCAALATGLTADGVLDAARATNLKSLALDLSSNRYGVVSGKKVEKLFHKIFDGQCIEDLAAPLLIGATDFSTGERVTLSKGPIAAAVRASISVPVLFAPYYHEGERRWLVDGGLVQNFPLDLALRHYDGDLIIGIDVASVFEPTADFSATSHFPASKDLRAAAFRSARIRFRCQQAHFPEDPRVVVIRPALKDYTSLHVTRIEEMVRIGERAVEQYLENHALRHR